jgi:hypothetical protein
MFEIYIIVNISRNEREQALHSYGSKEYEVTCTSGMNCLAQGRKHDELDTCGVTHLVLQASKRAIPLNQNCCCCLKIGTMKGYAITGISKCYV